MWQLLEYSNDVHSEIRSKSRCRGTGYEDLPSLAEEIGFGIKSLGLSRYVWFLMEK